VNKLFAYPGGKWPIRHKVVAAFPDHTTYVDVFGGAASILVTKAPSAGEVFNDKNEDIVNFFRVVKHRPAELSERARHWIHARKLFLEARDAPVPTDELERAFKFWVVTADSFGAIGGTFGTSKHGMHSVTRARMHLNLVSDRLQNVHIECLDFSKVITMYDGPETFFYLDPPYRGTNGGKNHYENLTDSEWVLLRDQLASIKGKFLLSSNNDKFVLDLFAYYQIRNIVVPETLARKKEGQTRREILVSNYSLPKEAIMADPSPAHGRGDGVRVRGKRREASRLADRKPARRKHTRRSVEVHA